MPQQTLFVVSEAEQLLHGQTVGVVRFWMIHGIRLSLHHLVCDEVIV